MFETAASELAREVDSALIIITVFSVVMLVAITGVMLYFVWRYRRSVSKTTKQIAGHTTLEVVWTIIPTLLVIGIFFVGYDGFAKMRQVPADVMVVEVTGQRWFWSFHYPDYDISANELVVPINKPVKLQLTTKVDDVLHSFYIPAMRIKEDTVPGMKTFMWFSADKLGKYNIFCAEYCGTDHSKMIRTLTVLSQVDYRRWIDKQLGERSRPIDLASAFKPDAKLAKAGAKLAKRYCAACHKGNGTGGGPYRARDLTKLQGWKAGTDLASVFTTISKGLDNTSMRAFGHMNAHDRLAIAQWVVSLAPGRAGPKPEALAQLAKDFPELSGAATKAPVISMDDAMNRVVEEGRRP